MEILILLLAIFIKPPPVYAYLDPGTGSYFFQLAIGGIFGGLFLLKTFWKQIKQKIHNKFGKKESV
jgi:hypothetical protein